MLAPRDRSATWETLAAEVGRLSAAAAGHELGAELRWRVRALERAVAVQSVALFELALGPTGRIPPPAVEAWSYDGATTADEIAEAAVWHTALVGLDAIESADLDVLRGPRAVINALEAR